MMAIRANTGRTDAGFSMLELAAALFVIGVGMMGALQMYNVVAGKLRHMQESAAAAQAVNIEIETLRALPFHQLTERNNAPFVSEPHGVEGLVNFTPLLTIEPHPDARLSIKHVTATVRWSGEHGRTIQKSAETLIADKGAPR